MAWVQSTNIRGPQGLPGTAGPIGTDGQPGRGVADANLDGAGHLIITYTDASTDDLGIVVGADGKGIEFAGSAPTYAELPTNLTVADAGKGYFVVADGKLYIWSGTAFPASGAGVEFRGPTGLQGAQGLAGGAGAAGADGAQGARGTSWFTGAGVPSTITGSQPGDLYLDTTTGDVYTLS